MNCTFIEILEIIKAIMTSSAEENKQDLTEKLCIRLATKSSLKP